MDSVSAGLKSFVGDAVVAEADGDTCFPAHAARPSAAWVSVRALAFLLSACKWPRWWSRS
eukprot:CAMPEP_0198576050 /NCGR_PEP_ID=MMETSP1462-20131121/117006_1 /TAXON_ID=1333877 /ORGANISM="Brandtodinium nutriculum, Strain RCC3387" /LENGTH=59 /DNA_ID=CAMNT_0044307303 /DNA_START=316 /DNA_END=491 /DNA_ORIENTATION=-